MAQNLIQAAVGLILVLVVVGGLLFVYYSRTNAVEKTGYGSLIMLLLVSLMIPVLWFMEGEKQAHAVDHQFEVAVERGAALYGQYCTYQCFGIDDTGEEPEVVNMTYNGYSLEDIDAMTDTELTRVISAGIFKSPQPVSPPPTNANLIQRSERYGGGLLSNDIDYLRTFLRATNEEYVRSNGYPEDVKPTVALVEYLEANAQTQYDAAISYFRNGRFGEPQDLTSQSTVSMDIVDIAEAQNACASTVSCYMSPNIKVKVGTQITWTNKSTVEHSVTAVEGDNTASPQAAADIFDSGLFGTNQTYTLTITEEMYNAGTPTIDDPNVHRLFYYCTIHPDMLAQLLIVP